MNAETLKRRWQAEDEQAINATIEALLQHAHGRKYLWWLLQLGAVGQQPFTGNALTTAFGCGEMNVGNRILDRIISTSPEGYITMMKEQENVRRSRDAELNAVRGDDRAPAEFDFGDGYGNSTAGNYPADG